MKDQVSASYKKVLGNDPHVQRNVCFQLDFTFPEIESFAFVIRNLEQVMKEIDSGRFWLVFVARI
jgi:hypothetical protein